MYIHNIECQFMRVAKRLTLRPRKRWISCHATCIAQYCLVQRTNLKVI